MNKQTFTITDIKDASNGEFSIVRLSNDKSINLRASEANALKREFASQLGTKTTDASGIITAALKGCTLTADFVDYKAGHKLVLDTNSTLVTEGASRDTELTRDGKIITVKAGDKAQIGDIFIYKTASFRKNLNSGEKTYYEIGLPAWSLTTLAANQNAVKTMVASSHSATPAMSIEAEMEAAMGM